MHVLQEHTLAGERHRTLRAEAAAVRAARVPGGGSPRRQATRRRLGVLLVEAGLHLIERADPSPRPASLSR